MWTFSSDMIAKGSRLSDSWWGWSTRIIRQEPVYISTLARLLPVRTREKLKAVGTLWKYHGFERRVGTFVRSIGATRFTATRLQASALITQSRANNSFLGTTIDHKPPKQFQRARLHCGRTKVWSVLNEAPWDQWLKLLRSLLGWLVVPCMSDAEYTDDMRAVNIDIDHWRPQPQSVLTGIHKNRHGHGSTRGRTWPEDTRALPGLVGLLPPLGRSWLLDWIVEEKLTQRK